MKKDLELKFHEERIAFLRNVREHREKHWQIKDLPIPGYTERLVKRNIIRTYHETLCMVSGDYDFLFTKISTLVPAVHQPSIRGVLENIKIDPHYFIEHLIYFDKDELQHQRLQIAMERLIKYYQLPKMQRDQVHLVLAYAYTKESNVRKTAEHIMSIKQPYTYVEVIQILDPAGELGTFLLKIISTPQNKQKIDDLEDIDGLHDYILIYLIACVDTLEQETKTLLQEQLFAKYALAENIENLSQLHIEYCQLRYALYKIHHHLFARPWWGDYLQRHKRSHLQIAKAAWKTTLYELSHEQKLCKDALAVIQQYYPLLTNSINLLFKASPIIMQQISMVAQQLLNNLSHNDKSAIVNCREFNKHLE